MSYHKMNSLKLGHFRMSLSTFKVIKKFTNSEMVIWEVWGGENLLRETGRNDLCNQNLFCRLLHLNSRGWLCKKPEGSSDIYVHICLCKYASADKDLSLAFLARTPEHWGNSVKETSSMLTEELAHYRERRRWAHRWGLWRLFLSTSVLPHAALCRHNLHTRGRFSILALAFIPATSLALRILLQPSPGSSYHFSCDYS